MEALIYNFPYNAQRANIRLQSILRDLYLRI